MSRAQFEERLESALTDLAVLAATRNTNPGGNSDSFCVSYLIPLLDIANAAVNFGIPILPGYRSELKSILLYDSNVGTHEVFDVATVIDFGPDDDRNQYLDAATVPIPLNAAGVAALAGSSRVLLDTNAATAPTGDYKAMGVEVLPAGMAFVTLDTPTTGITDVLATIRYYL